MAFSPENLKIWVNSREIHAFIQTATYPPFTKGTFKPLNCTYLLHLTLGEGSTTKAHDSTKLRAKHSKIG